MEVGDKYKRTYPFKLVSYPEMELGQCVGVDDAWVGGCKQIADSEFSSVSVADGVGFIEFEVLAVVEMPRKYQDRVIYRVTMTDPDGVEKKKNTAHTVTMSMFNKFIDHDDAYWDEYEVEE